MTALAEPESPQDGKVSFGLNQLNSPSPIWAKWIFRSYFIISKAFIGWAGMVGIFSPPTLHEIIVTTTLLVDPVMLGFSNLFGVAPATPQDQQAS